MRLEIREGQEEAREQILRLEGSQARAVVVVAGTFLVTQLLADLGVAQALVQRLRPERQGMSQRHRQRRDRTAETQPLMERFNVQRVEVAAHRRQAPTACSAQAAARAATVQQIPSLAAA